jgi:hypothetical protein
MVVVKVVSRQKLATLPEQSNLKGDSHNGRYLYRETERIDNQDFS